MQASMMIVLMALVGLVCAVPAAAQTAPVRDWESVVFVSRIAAPGEIRGRLVALDEGAVTIRIDGQRISLPLADVRRIQKEGDGLANGALIGALVFGLRCAMICGQGMSGTGNAPLVVLTTAGLGALIGAGIDAAHVGRTTIYRAGTQPVPENGMCPAIAFRVRF